MMSCAGGEQGRAQEEEEPAGLCQCPAQNSPAEALADPGVFYSLQLSQAHQVVLLLPKLNFWSSLLVFYLGLFFFFVLHLQVFYH